MRYVEVVLVIALALDTLLFLHHLREELIKLCGNFLVHQRLGIGTLGTYQQGECWREFHVTVGQQIDKRHGSERCVRIFGKHLAIDVGQIGDVVVVEHTFGDALRFARVEEDRLPAVGHCLCEASWSFGLCGGFSIGHLRPLGLSVLDGLLGMSAVELEVEAVRLNGGVAVGKDEFSHFAQSAIPCVYEVVDDHIGRNGVVGGKEVADIQD